MGDSPLNILMVHPHDLRYDPWTIRILALAREVKKQGHHVRLCHLPRKEKPAHNPIRSLPETDIQIHDLQPRQQHIVPNTKLLYALAKECDILHLQKCFASVSLPLIWISRFLRKPLHYDWDDNETAISKLVEKRWLSRFQLASFERNLPHFASTISVSSHALKEKAIAYGFPSARIFHIPVGADTDRFHPRQVSKEILTEFGLSPEKITVLYVGQLEGASHAGHLIEAAPLIRSQNMDCQFLFAGGGEQLDGLLAQAQTSPARSVIHIAGYVPHELITQLVGAADICVACFDDSEATRAKSPLKLAEYLAAGKAIVASDVGEVPWMLRDCGILVEPNNPLALAEGILQYAHDEPKRRKDGEQARQRALELYTWPKSGETLLKAYAQSIKPIEQA
ncbi:glycosyltransferase [bacterium]|nr:glycosyltransferase [bacterium]